MKIRIKKQLSERTGKSPTSLLPVEELFGNLGLLIKEKEVLESLFNKDLLFYDLETTGLRRKRGEFGQISDMIHQIAILKYSPNGDPSTISAENPNDYYVAKADITDEYSDRSKKAKEKRAKILDQTPENEYTEFKEFIRDDQLEIPAKNRDDVKSILGLFFHIFLHYNLKNKKKALLGKKGTASAFKKFVEKYISVIDFEEEESEKIEKDKDEEESEKIEKDKDEEESEKIEKDKDGQGEEGPLLPKERLKKIIENTNPSKEDLIFFYHNIFNEDTVDGGISTYYNNRGNDFVKSTVEKIILFLKQTTEENKVFTNYDEFPLKKYRNKGYEGTVSEKEALEGMMKFIDQQGAPSTNQSQPNGDYVLVGQNIISFDNPFVIARCEFHGINNTQNFRNSYVYDTRFLFSLMIKYFKTLVYFYGLAYRTHFRIKEMQEILDTQQPDEERTKKLKKAIEDFIEIGEHNTIKIKPQIDEVRVILKNLKKSGKSKGKLETLMKAFIENAPKQTHTADDDCEKLAAVFIPAMQKFYEIYEKTYDFVEMMDNKQIIRTYRIVKNSPVFLGKKTKSLKTHAGIGTPAAIGFEKTKGAGEIRKKIVDKFVQDLEFNYLRQNNIDKEAAKKLIDAALKEKENLEGTVATPEKINKFYKFLNFTEQDVINWYQTNIGTPGNSFSVQENRKRIKIKILKENRNA